MKKTVLIIEDEKSIVDILDFHLRRSGYETLSALDGEKGLQARPYPAGR
jgi:DNA-binding response OmpR family regulator